MSDKLTRGVHHIGLTVPDLDQARAFFCGLLGLPPAPSRAHPTDGIDPV